MNLRSFQTQITTNKAQRHQRDIVMIEIDGVRREYSHIVYKDGQFILCAFESPQKQKSLGLKIKERKNGLIESEADDE
jgi:hypothetical protein